MAARKMYHLAFYIYCPHYSFSFSFSSLSTLQLFDDVKIPYMRVGAPALYTFRFAPFDFKNDRTFVLFALSPSPLFTFIIIIYLLYIYLTVVLGGGWSIK